MSSDREVPDNAEGELETLNIRFDINFQSAELQDEKTIKLFVVFFFSFQTPYLPVRSFPPPHTLISLHLSSLFCRPPQIGWTLFSFHISHESSASRCLPLLSPVISPLPSLGTSTSDSSGWRRWASCESALTRSSFPRHQPKPHVTRCSALKKISWSWRSLRTSEWIKHGEVCGEQFYMTGWCLRAERQHGLSVCFWKPPLGDVKFSWTMTSIQTQWR